MRFDNSDLLLAEDKQTANQSLCQCPNSGGAGGGLTLLGHQLQRFDLELAAEGPSRHIHSPIP